MSWDNEKVSGKRFRLLMILEKKSHMISLLPDNIRSQSETSKQRSANMTDFTSSLLCFTDSFLHSSPKET